MLRNLRPETRPHGGVQRAERRFIVAGIVPALLFYLVFRFYPVGYAFYMSLHDWKLLSQVQTFVGLDNYVHLFRDPLFLKVVINTFYFAIASTILTAIISLVIALILNPIGWGSTLLRLIYFLPVMTATIASATIWLWLYQARFGLLNQLLALVKLPPVLWLISTTWAMPSIILMSVWGSIGFNVVIFLAGLRGIPKEYYEAAAIDGASALQIARRITVPLVTPVLAFVLATSLIGGFNVFQQVYLMTRGGPQDATRVLALHIYDYAFLRLFMGQAAAMAFVLFAIVLTMTVLQTRLQRTDWEL
jgi:multiple sugar transport system permease protein